MNLAIPANLFSNVYLSKVIIQLYLERFAARTLGALQSNNRSISEHNTNTVLKSSYNSNTTRRVPERQSNGDVRKE